jgi:squalene-hopene/tetraprenyl-beta-curcumene cyclase
MVGMQSRSGGWGAFDADNEALWLYKLPICDFGKVTDEPSADVTAHALEALGPGAATSDASAGLDWLLERAGAGRLLVRALGRQPRLRHRRRVPALEACGVSTGAPRDPPRDRLAGLGQQPDGGFGEDIAPTAIRPGAAAARRRLHKRPGPCSPTSRGGAATPCPREGPPSIFFRSSARR